MELILDNDYPAAKRIPQKGEVKVTPHDFKKSRDRAAKKKAAKKSKSKPTISRPLCNGKDSGCSEIKEGDGDCDKNSDCQKGLTCGKDNCFRGSGSPFDKTDDCCYNPKK